MALGMLVALLGGDPSAAASGPDPKGHSPAPPLINILDAINLGIQPLDGARAKDFALPGIDGKTLRLSDFRGKVVILSFWASWCPACRMEMPTLQKVHRRFKDRALAVVSVSIDTQGEKPVAPLVKKLGLTFPVLLDPGQKVMDRYGVTLIPTAFILGRNGEMIGKTIGPKDWDGANGRRILGKLIEDSRPAPAIGARAEVRK